jgi:hypothetical protein
MTTKAATAKPPAPPAKNKEAIIAAVGNVHRERFMLLPSHRMWRCCGYGQIDIRRELIPKQLFSATRCGSAEKQNPNFIIPRSPDVSFIRIISRLDRIPV